MTHVHLFMKLWNLRRLLKTRKMEEVTRRRNSAWINSDSVNSAWRVVNVYAPSSLSHSVRTDLDRVGKNTCSLQGADVWLHTCMYTYYIFTWFGGRRRLWAMQAKLLAGSLIHACCCMCLCMCFTRDACTCARCSGLYPRRLSLASLTCDLDCGFVKEAIYICQETYVLVLCLCSLEWCAQ